MWESLWDLFFNTTLDVKLRTIYLHGPLGSVLDASGMTSSAEASKAEMTMRQLLFYEL